LAAQEKRAARGRGCVSDGLGGQACMHWAREEGWVRERSGEGEAKRRGMVNLVTQHADVQDCPVWTPKHHCGHSPHFECCNGDWRESAHTAG
jgi:hypothetical protein